MYEQDEEVAHPGNGINTSKSHDIQPKLVIRHGQAVTAGAFDHIRKGIVIPSGQTYTLGAFDREAWEDYDGTPEEAQELPPNTLSVGMILFKHIPPIPGAGIPGMADLLNPTEQKLELQ
jgi:hypothetical protein